MAILNVQEAVLRKAEEEVRKVAEEAQRSAHSYWERQSARLREEHERRVADARQVLESALEREAAAKAAADRHELLRIKNDIIDEIFQKAVDGILTLHDDGYAKWVKAQVARLPKIEQVTLSASERDQSLLSQAVSAAGRSNMKVSDKPMPIKGGFLVQGEQADLDYSVEALMQTLRESLTEEVAAKLFGEGQA